ncbi:cysteine hydrolase family protein [Liquorilactobacillus uvarum]|uniref:Isochorismatase n=1 Tax=Liquorilactobacillus uvarum DSM 19971 TaxID=1423812 RepID=A0A0R1PWZ7_9LACO|nr:isochorismatase family cysteine hydrolase [Liquorilactobacillus uvarum]KRL36878.1 isochorismatase [Liquorilactobacillus uvarum DSM 19971]
MPKKALLIIDYTNDFVHDKGALTCGKPGQKIEDTILSLADSFLANNDYVILPTDCHEANDPFHPETRLFPPHNIAQTWGHAFYGKLSDWYKKNHSLKNVYFFDKNRYSSFANTNLENYLRSRKITDIHLTGVCTDICVLHTAVDAYNKNFNLYIHQDATASFDPIGHQWALKHFKNCLGAKLV